MTSNNFHNRVDQISNSIRDNGYHITVVGQDMVPRFAYTVGARNFLDFEIILAGAAVFLLDDILDIIRMTIDWCRRNDDHSRIIIKHKLYGSFTLGRVDQSWAKLLLTDAIDYFEVCNVEAYQILPDANHNTIDVPDLESSISTNTEPAWRWLHEPWELPIPHSSTALTNFDALRGHPITEASRWELDEWELFAGSGPDSPDEEVRVVPIGTLLAVDETLWPVISLKVGKSLWREEDDKEWTEW